MYLFTLAPTVALIDSGELTDAAWSIGNAHPPGFPLFILLTHPFTRIPIRSVAWRANLSCAFFSAIAAVFIALAVQEMLLLPQTAQWKETRKRKTQSVITQLEPTPPSTIALIAIASGLQLAFSKTVWRYAVETEVYAVNTALMTATVWLMLRWCRTRKESTLYAAALLFGLALGVHHVTIGLGAAGIAVLITRTAGAAFWRSKQVVISAVLLALGLLVYLEVPIAARRNPAMNWANPRTAKQVWDHATGKAYRVYLSSTEESVSAQAGRFVDYLAREFGPPWLPLALLIAAIGLVTLWRRQRTVFWYVTLFIAADFMWIALYPVKHDQDAYVIPTFVALLLAFAAGARRLAEMRPRFAPAIVVIPLLALVVAYPLRDRSRFWVAKDYTSNALQIMAPNSLLVTGDWQMYSPLRYVMDVEGTRRDVAVLESGFLQSDWYQDELARNYPELSRACSKEATALVATLHRFAQDPSLFKNDSTRSEFYDRIDDYMLAAIAWQLQRGAVYLTVDTALGWDTRDAGFIKRLTASYDIVPRGVVMEVMAGHRLRDLHRTPIATRGLIDGTVHYDDDDPVPNEIVPSYRAAFQTRARYLALSKQYPEALADYKEAVALDPENRMLEQEMLAVQAMTR